MPTFALTPNQRVRIAILVLDNKEFKVAGLADVRAFNKMKTGLKLYRLMVLLAGGKSIAGDYISKGASSVFELEPVAIDFLLEKVLARITSGPVLEVLGPLVDAIDAYKAGQPLPVDGLGTVDVEAEPWTAPEDDPIASALVALREVAELAGDADALVKARKVVEALDAREAQILSRGK